PAFIIAVAARAQLVRRSSLLPPECQLSFVFFSPPGSSSLPAVVRLPRQPAFPSPSPSNDRLAARSSPSSHWPSPHPLSCRRAPAPSNDQPAARSSKRPASGQIQSTRVPPELDPILGLPSPDLLPPPPSPQSASSQSPDPASSHRRTCAPAQTLRRDGHTLLPDLLPCPDEELQNLLKDSIANGRRRRYGSSSLSFVSKLDF
ncbi:hypothetical protein ACLOJK_023978, partial [Asimina triloba]